MWCELTQLRGHSGSWRGHGGGSQADINEWDGMARQGRRGCTVHPLPPLAWRRRREHPHGPGSGGARRHRRPHVWGGGSGPRRGIMFHVGESGSSGGWIPFSPVRAGDQIVLPLGSAATARPSTGCPSAPRWMGQPRIRRGLFLDRNNRPNHWDFRHRHFWRGQALTSLTTEVSLSKSGNRGNTK